VSRIYRVDYFELAFSFPRCLAFEFGLRCPAFDRVDCGNGSNHNWMRGGDSVGGMIRNLGAMNNQFLHLLWHPQ
jgi:hypothetical protein